MKDKMDEVVGRALRGWITTVHSHAGIVVSGLLALTLLFGVYAGLNLGVNSDNLTLVSPDIPSRRNHAEFSRHFPNLENALLVVVDGETPELVRQATDQLETVLRANPERFEEVYQPGGGGFFERNGLLYRSVDELDDFADEMATIQPIIAELERDASIANLSRLVELGLESVAQGTAQADDWPAVLDRVGEATIGVYSEYPIAISWEEVLLQGSAVDMSTRRILIVHAVLEFGSVFAAGRALDEIRSAAASLGLVPERGVTVRITGNPALNYEEMSGILWDIFVAGIFCFAIVVVILWFAMRSWHLVVGAVATLLVGLVWTAAFAAAAVGYLNIVSLAVAILFIGLGVDFGIHLGTRYADVYRNDGDPLASMCATVDDVGGSLVLCTITTSIGFLVFVPTDYHGVAQLGLIAGVGMVIIVGLTFTFLPALLFSWLRFDSASLTGAVRFETHWWRWFEEHPQAVRNGAVAAAVIALALIPQAHFSPNILDIRDPETESVQTFDDLLAEAGSASPWYVDAIAPNLSAADDLAARLGALDVVSHTITLASYVPADQEEKHEILADVAYLLDSPGSSAETATPPSTDRQSAALRNLHDFLAEGRFDTGHPALAASMRGLQSQLATFLDKLGADEDPEKALARLDQILLSGLPAQLSRLREALEPEEITIDSLPEELRRRMVAADGQARVQIFPRYDLDGEEQIRPFVDGVASIAPQASGIAVNLIALEEVTKRSFQQSLISALLLISLLLWLLWRRLQDMLFVLAPLLLSAGLAVGCMGLFDVPFNFVNVIVIPLMFGIGVDSGIHLVHRSHSAIAARDGLLGTTTARAVYYSAITTTVSFGSLAFSAHRGMASLGILLTFGMVLTIVGNLIVLPALIALRRPDTDSAKAVGSAGSNG